MLNRTLSRIKGRVRRPYRGLGGRQASSCLPCAQRNNVSLRTRLSPKTPHIRAWLYGSSAGLRHLGVMRRRSISAWWLALLLQPCTGASSSLCHRRAEGQGGHGRAGDRGPLRRAWGSAHGTQLRVLCAHCRGLRPAAATATCRPSCDLLLAYVAAQRKYHNHARCCASSAPRRKLPCCCPSACAALSAASPGM